MSDEIQNAAEASNIGTPANDTRSPTEYFTPPEATPSGASASGASGSGTRAEVVVHIVDAPVTPVAAPFTPVTPVPAPFTPVTPVPAPFTPVTPVPAPSSLPAVAASGGERGGGRGGRGGHGRGGGRGRGFPVGSSAARRGRGQNPAAHHTSTVGSLIALFDRALDGLEGPERITMASILCCSLASVAVILIVIIILRFY